MNLKPQVAGFSSAVHLQKTGRAATVLPAVSLRTSPRVPVGTGPKPWPVGPGHGEIEDPRVSPGGFLCAGPRNA